MAQPYAYPQYRLPRAYSNQYANPGVTSNLAPPLIPHVMPPKNPPGGPSETTANAEPNPTVTEEEAPVSNLYHPHTNRVTERVFVTRSTPPRPQRTCVNGGCGTGGTSRGCAPGPRNTREPKGARATSERCTVSIDPILETMRLDLIDSDAVALEVVQALRPVPVYPSPKLKKGTIHGRGTKVRSRAATAEARRRDGIRTVNEELSKYYELPDDRTEWECPELLSKGKHDHVRSYGDNLSDQYSLSATRYRVSRGTAAIRMKPSDGQRFGGPGRHPEFFFFFFLNAS